MQENGGGLGRWQLLVVVSKPQQSKYIFSITFVLCDTEGETRDGGENGDGKVWYVDGEGEWDVDMRDTQKLLREKG